MGKIGYTKNSDLYDMIKFGIFVVIVVLILIIGTYILAFFDSKYQYGDTIRIENMKRDYKDRFLYEMKKQYDTEIELYVIMPEQYGREEIDNFADELGNKYKCNLISIEFRYNHVIYKYRKKEF